MSDNNVVEVALLVKYLDNTEFTEKVSVQMMNDDVDQIVELMEDLEL